MELVLETEQQQEALGEQLAKLCTEACVIYLEGDLGTGKTTFARGFLRGLGYAGRVKSPTYTIMEPYHLPDSNCYHFDLYRLADPGELEYLGVRDLLDARSHVLVEWPEMGHGELPPADIQIDISHLKAGRLLQLSSKSTVGEAILSAYQPA